MILAVFLPRNRRSRRGSAHRLETLETDLLHQLHVDREGLRQLHGPWASVGLRIVYGQLDLQPAELGTGQPLGDTRRAGERVAAHVQPQIVAEAGGLDDQRVTIPARSRVPVPR